MAVTATSGPQLIGYKVCRHVPPGAEHGYHSHWQAASGSLWAGSYHTHIKVTGSLLFSSIAGYNVISSGPDFPSLRKHPHRSVLSRELTPLSDWPVTGRSGTTRYSMGGPLVC